MYNFQNELSAFFLPTKCYLSIYHIYPGVRLLAAERGGDHKPPAAAPRPLRLHRHQHPRPGRQDRALEGWVTYQHLLALLLKLLPSTI